ADRYGSACCRASLRMVRGRIQGALDRSSQHACPRYAAVIAWLIAGCAATEPTAWDDVAAHPAAIVNGQIDTVHRAVMLQSCSFPCICSGTVVKKDDALGVGWVLTAAHCVGGERAYVAAQEAATFAPNSVSYH